MSAGLVPLSSAPPRGKLGTLRTFALALAICLQWSLPPALADSPPAPAESFIKFFQQNALPLAKEEHLEPLYEAIGKRRFVLLGESTHGTREYYQWRATISKHLIEEKSFNYVAIEGDWQAIYHINNYVKGRTAEELDARTLMHEELTRWPQWMWANEEFAEFVEWLRTHNAQLPVSEQVGVFGLDMQNPEESMEAVLSWLAEHDKSNYQKVRKIYQQIHNFPDNFRGYAQHLVRGGDRLDELLAVPVNILFDQIQNKPQKADKPLWSAWQNALAVQAAEAQFHGVTTRGPDSWNARARHMHDVLLHLAQRHGNQSRGIVWAHNTHVGDASATDMKERGEVNIGELLRVSQGADQVFILGFGTYKGEVIAGPAWGAKLQTLPLLPARPGSFEDLLHQSELQQALLLFDEQAREGPLGRSLPQRAVGVVYRPPHEAYVNTRFTHRYDGFIYFGTTSALSPLNGRAAQAKRPSQMAEEY